MPNLNDNLAFSVEGLVKGTKALAEAGLPSRGAALNLEKALSGSEFEIGYRFARRQGKRTGVETVVDIYKTYNSAGELVKTSYVTESKCCGQIVKNYDVPAATIARSTMLHKENE